MRRGGCCHRSNGNRAKSESIEAIVHPCSTATAACWASAISFPVAPDSLHSRSKIAMWSGSGPTMRAVGRSTSEDTRAKAPSRVEGGSKTRALVVRRTKAPRTRMESANGSGPVANLRIEDDPESESSTCAQIRTLTSGSNNSS